MTAGTIVNQIKRDYNGLGQLTAEWQSHAGALTGSTPKVQYAYSTMAGGANHSRLTSMTYPNGRVVSYVYSSAGVDESVSRLTSITDSTGTLESYDYRGLGTVVARKHPQPGVDLTFLKQGAESNGDAGDKYRGLDRFGRVVDQRWIKTSTGTATDRFQYGYDRDGNRLWRDNLVNAAWGEVYTYDGLNQLASTTRGTLNGTKTGVTGSPTRTQSWDYDAVGNFDSVTTNGSAQTRTANKQNEITAIGGATTPMYDLNGNMTGDEAGKAFKYDAWNRLVEVRATSGGTLLATYKYNGLGRRASDTKSGTTTDLYYSAAWQVLEERVGGTLRAQYTWSPVYVDAMIVRDRDTNADGTLDERLWVQQDANFNVTALVDGTGAVGERFAYDSYGVVSVLDAGFGARGSSAYAGVYTFQGLRYDATAGLHEARNRWYSPTLGRFVTDDPLGYRAEDVNLYRFVGNSPGMGVDPWGLLDPKGKEKFDPKSKPKTDPKVQQQGQWREIEIPVPPRFQWMVPRIGYMDLRLAPNEPPTVVEPPGHNIRMPFTPNGLELDFEERGGAKRSLDPSSRNSGVWKTKPGTSQPKVGPTVGEQVCDRKDNRPCFPAGTPVRTPDGWLPIEQLKKGDRILSRDENDPNGDVLTQEIEEVFVRQGLIWNLHVGGQIIQTTAEHPFFVRGKGWVACQELQIGDFLSTETGGWVGVEDIFDTGEWKELYNFRVANYHTYFIGVFEWGFSVWTHNACYFIKEGVRRSVAAREAGLPIVPAILEQAGQPDKPIFAGIDELFSPKTEIDNDQRFQDILRDMGTVAGRLSFAATGRIHVEKLGEPGQPASIPLRAVKLK